MPEAERTTRASRIDPKLRAQGWRIVPYEETTPLTAYDRCAIREFPTANGPVDYALCVGGRILGLVEAKKLTLGPQNVLTQSERYAKGLAESPFNFQGLRAPFLYSTNGEIIWHHDVRHPLNRSHTIASFHTPDALTELIDRDVPAATRALADLPANDLVRPYQWEANQAVEQAISHHKRVMLVAMATGTGKTLTMVHQVYRLMKSGAAKRILFLVDRRALAAQAVRAFASFEAEPGLKFDKIYEVYSQRFHREDLADEPFDPKMLPTAYLTDPKPGHAFVYVCTIQRMMINLFGRQAIAALGDEVIDEDAEEMPIPIHAFDVVIADECHRGYASAELSAWRNTLDHFDAIKIGLTATPAAHTTAYFKDVVFRYEYERAVREGYLVDYDVVAINSNVRIKGIFLKEGEQIGVVNPDSGAEQLDFLEDERQFPTEDVEEKVTSPDSNRKILEEIKRYALEHEQRTGRFPKTLIFAVNDLPHLSHADRLVDLARDVFGRGDSFVQKITGHVDRPLQRIREFRNRQLPGVVVTVDMLTTGVDIPDLEFIVFLRPVKSRILFEQMLGRGTRKGEHIPEKSHFVVFDCFNGTLLEYFRQAAGMTIEPPQREARTIVEIIEEIWQNRDREYNTRCLVKRLHRINREVSAEGRQRFEAYLPQGDLGRYAVELPGRLRQDFPGTMALLRDPGFQDLLMNYPRPKRTFYVAYETEDEVTSAWLIRDGDGREYKPEDYLTAFAKFVSANVDKIEGIRVLLNRPRDWRSAALTDLRQKLLMAPQRFSSETLQRAHEQRYHKALVDIISMVKHAVREEEPLYTAEERVNRALAKVTAGRTFTAEQQQWLDRIRVHLIENLSIEEPDFDILPVFTRAGGLGRASQVFGKDLLALIAKLNEAVAA